MIIKDIFAIGEELSQSTKDKVNNSREQLWKGWKAWEVALESLEKEAHISAESFVRISEKYTYILDRLEELRQRLAGLDPEGEPMEDPEDIKLN